MTKSIFESGRLLLIFFGNLLCFAPSYWVCVYIRTYLDEVNVFLCSKKFSILILFSVGRESA